MKQINDKTWVYVFVRTDLPVEQQMVQSNHASLEAGLEFGRKSNEISSLIVLQVPDKQSLEEAMQFVESKGIRCIDFHEPDWDYGLTAFGSEPVTLEQRKIFRNWKLWRLK